ncbi:MAG: DNA mismatch endonuclease Vsr [Bacteroidetes bacterium]|nr:DNA mismatch endonuclease Vsr [Bacteroidota bacterium]
MADVHDRETRSYNMSQIKGKNTKPEILVRKFLFARGFRYKLHDKKLPGKPDLVFPKLKTVLFIHGCFWHGHENCKYFIIPKTRTDWWLKKIRSNKQRDVDNYLKISKEKWRVLTIFECELKSDKRQTTLNRILKRLKRIHEAV